MFWAILRGHVPAVQRAERGGPGHRLAVPGLPGGAPPQVRPQPAPAARLSAALVQHRRRRVDLDPRRVGGGDADRARAHRRAQDPLPGLEAVPVDDDDDRPRGGPGADRHRRRLLLPARLGLHRPPHPGRRPAAAVRDDGDRDLADAAARVPRARGGHDARQRPHLEALVRPLRRWCAASSAASSTTSSGSACRARRRPGGSSRSAPIPPASSSPAASSSIRWTGPASARTARAGIACCATSACRRAGRS